MYFSAVGGFTNSSEADREFDELQARAYGPHPDIGVDPAALARLRELEAAHRANVERRPDAFTSDRATDPEVAPSEPGESGPPPMPEPTSWLRSVLRGVTATWRRRRAWVIGALVLAASVVATVLTVSAPHPDATLHATATEADRQVRKLVVEDVPFVDLDAAPLRAYGSYRGLEIWSGVGRFDSPCLVAVRRPNGIVSGWRCTPASAALIMDVSSSGDGFNGFDGLAGDGIIRFIFRGDTVDAYVYLMPEAD